VTQERQPGKRRATFIGVVATFILLVLLVASVWTTDHRAEDKRARAEIQKRLDAIRAAGEPVTAQDLEKLFPDPPPEHDASNLLAATFAALSIPDSVNDLHYFVLTNFHTRTEPLDERTKANLEAVLNKNQAALDAVPWDQITNAWIGSGFARGFGNAAHYSMNPLIRSTKLLCLSAVYQAELGHGSEAAQELGHGLALARVLRSDTIPHHTGRRFGEQFVCDALERVINRVDLTDNDLMSLERALADSHPQGLCEAVINLRCLDIFGMEMIQTAPAEDFFPGDLSNSNWVTMARAKLVGTLFVLSGKAYRNSDYLGMLDERAQWIAALGLPPNERFAEFERVNAAHGRRQDRKTFASTMWPIPGGLIDTVHIDADVFARLQVARTALAIERWRLSHEKRVPDSLSELVPDYLPSVPLDSFDDQPLRYRKLARGYLVYSIGSDLKDDGGKEKPAGASGIEGYDITFRIER
jgi:hypothetical protein